MVRETILVVGLCAVVPATCVEAEEPSIFGMIQVELSCDDDARVYQPADIAWDDEGQGYLLCAGSCKVLIIDEKYEIVAEIGRCGEGPGEIENAKTVEILGDRIFVFQGFRVDVFNLSGEHQSRVVLMKEVHDTAVAGGRLLGTTKDGENLMLLFDVDGNIVQEFGPKCSEDTWDERYLKCGTMTLFNDDDRVMLLDRVAATALWDEGGEWGEKWLGLNSGETWREGSAVHKRFAVNAVCGVPNDDIALMLYMEERRDKHVSYGVVNGDWQIVKIGETSDQVRRMEISKTGDLWLLLWSSVVKVFKCTGTAEAARMEADDGTLNAVTQTNDYCWEAR